MLRVAVAVLVVAVALASAAATTMKLQITYDDDKCSEVVSASGVATSSCKCDSTSCVSGSKCQCVSFNAFNPNDYFPDGYSSVKYYAESDCTGQVAMYKAYTTSCTDFTDTEGKQRTQMFKCNDNELKRQACNDECDSCDFTDAIATIPCTLDSDTGLYEKVLCGNAAGARTVAVSLLAAAVAWAMF
eukprot:TRINITY_DN1562_c0_g1_i5.p1 TRINITY_DN1562_c0_g1~~TRINITY_DN1562_c0_g1_i5.p1  ORF type:complete len:213 (+),score=63.18 TRINITY_DN1562_c0_g1_i5:80-640(+)